MRLGTWDRGPVTSFRSRQISKGTGHITNDAPDQGSTRRIGVADLRVLLRPFGLDRHIRRAGSNSTITNLVFEQVEQAERAAALIAQAWGGEKVLYVPGVHHARVEVLREIDRYGTWPPGWRRGVWG